MSAFIALTIGSFLGSFRDPVVVMFAIGNGPRESDAGLAVFPFIRSDCSRCPYDALCLALLGGAPAGVGIAARLAFYINCAIGYTAYGIFRIAHRDLKKTSK
jgi:hypothetical protein